MKRLLICISAIGGIIYFVVLSFFINGGHGDNSLFDYWNVVWTCVGAFAVPASIWIFWKESQRDYLKAEQRRQEEEKNQQQELLDRNVPHFISLYDQFEFLKKSNRDSDKIKSEIKHLEAMEEAKYLLHNFQRFFGADVKSPSEIEEDKAYYIYSVVLKLQDEKDYFLADDEIATQVIDNFSQNSDTKSCDNNDTKSDGKDELLNSETHSDLSQQNSVSLKRATSWKIFNQILLVRTVKSSKHPDFDGNWKISSQRAKNIKYVIGVMGNVNSDKKYRGIIKVNSNDGYQVVDDGRIIFFGEKIDGESSLNSVESNKFKATLIRSLRDVGIDDFSEHDDLSKIIETIIDPWKGINPTVYLGHLVKRYQEQSDY